MKEFVEFVLVGAISCLVILGSFSLVSLVNSTNFFPAPLVVIPTIPIPPSVVALVLDATDFDAAEEASSTIPDTPPPEPAPESVSLSKVTVPTEEDKPRVVPKPKPTPPSTNLVVDAPLTSLEMKDILALHNSARRVDGVGPLIWSESLTESAQSWAHSLAEQSCALKHSGGPYGENIYYSRKYGSGQTPRKVSEVMSGFLEEKDFYNYDKNSCKAGEICGHYTQIVWADTTKVGCARSLCLSDEREEIWVCHYSPQGNIEGVRPY